MAGLEGNVHDEVTAPDWLTCEFMEKACKLKVVSRNVKFAVAAGENYGSVIYRVGVKITRNGILEDKSFIVKVQPRSTEMAKAMTETDAFHREMKAFTTIIPELNRLLETSSAHKINPFGAKFYYYEKDLTKTVIVLEDLKETGFKMADKSMGLDLNHCLFVMKTIARYHAASVVLKYLKPELFEPFMDSVWREELKTTFESVYSACIRSLASAIENLPDYKERFFDKIMKIAPNSFGYLVNGVRRDDEEFNVLCHGDLWLNNMLFRYSNETGEVSDMRLVDFQLGHWTSPAVDLQYFLHTSPSVDIADKHDILVEQYHKTLGETFTELGFQHFHPTLKQMNKQLDRRGLYGALISFTIYEVLLVERDQLPDMEEIITKGGSINISAGYIKAMKKILPILEKKGYI